MKALKISELDIVVNELQWLQGGFLQKTVVSNRDVVGLFFYKQGQGQWLVMDFTARSPSVWLVEDWRSGKAKNQPPSFLFLRSHFEGERVDRVTRDQKLGRVLNIEFSSGKTMVLHLIPHAPNLLLSSGEKSIALHKPRELELFENQPENSNLPEVSYQQLLNEWQQGFRKKANPTEGRQNPTRLQKIKKLKTALSKIESSLDQFSGEAWRLAGEFLVQCQSVESSFQEFPSLIDKNLSLAENIENCFAKSKKRKEKIKGAEIRQIELQKELQELEAMSDKDYLAQQSRRTPQRIEKTSKTSIKTRKKELSKALQIYVGQSAKDNMALLKKAKAWDYWLHLKDFPSAHGFVFRNKGQQVGDAILFQAAQFLVACFAEKNKGILSGEKLEVIWTEVRFVTPIKGDKMGRVTFRNEKVVVVQV